ncbi:unnamed protein product [Lactuca virosa]|uniref:Elongation factor EFG domain-containing protein n=1 Tax=Lactuca virosa TaxID=75947 RepID=A0AAU9M474_9ASTR|nr:unnamed protein product [Lactuca virosa]
MTALPTVELDPPAISMTFGVNDSPLAALDGSQEIGDRLLAEAATNLAINVIPGLVESYEVQRRGELQLGILLENMRRENFELSVFLPRVMIVKGVKLEPIEEVTIEHFLTGDRVEVTDMGPVAGNFGGTRMTLTCPSRGLVGYNSVFSSDTHGT